MMYLPEGDKPVMLQPGDVAGGEYICLSLGAFDRAFHDCADGLIPKSPTQ